MSGRRVCQFSCGAASAVATKLTLAHHSNVVIVNAYIKEEDEDNRRFLFDCALWFGLPITVVQNDKYQASTDEVWRRKRFIKGPHGAPCSLELKRSVLASIAEPGDINVVGLTSEEDDRFQDLCERFPEGNFEAPLIQRQISKADCLAMVDRAGIVLPRMYRLGYQNANCVGCPKGGQNYWQKIRKDFPERFRAIAAIQDEIGLGAGFLRFRSGPRKNERMMLKELPMGDGNLGDQADFSCSFYCELAEGEILNP